MVKTMSQRLSALEASQPWKRERVRIGGGGEGGGGLPTLRSTLACGYDCMCCVWWNTTKLSPIHTDMHCTYRYALHDMHTVHVFFHALCNTCMTERPQLAARRNRYLKVMGSNPTLSSKHSTCRSPAVDGLNGSSEFIRQTEDRQTEQRINREAGRQTERDRPSA